MGNNVGRRALDATNRRVWTSGCDRPVLLTKSPEEYTRMEPR